MKRIDWALMVALLFMFVAPSFIGQTFATSASPALTSKTLATAQDYPSSLFIYKGYAYWLYSDDLTYQFQIYRVPTTGVCTYGIAPQCSLVVSVDPSTFNFVVNGNYVYYSNSTGIYRVSVNSGPSTLIVACSCDDNLHIYSTYIYFINDNGLYGGNIERVSISGGTPTLIAAAADAIQITIYQSYIYWYGAFGEIGKVPLNGGTDQVLYGGTSCETFGYGYDTITLTVDSGFIYWVADCNTIVTANVYKMSINGGTVTTLFTASSGYSIFGLAYDSGNGKIFFSYTNDQVGTGSGIYSVSSSGGTATQLISITYPTSVAVSSGKVYFINLGTFRYPKQGGGIKSNTGSVRVFTP